MRRLVTDPIVHFVLIGAALFAAYTLLGDDAPSDAEIVVSSGRIEHLATVFARTWQRPPSRLELEGLIADHVREEAAYREGMAIGLDTDDVVIRRRIRQKLEFIARDLAAAIEPSDEELSAFLAEHPEKFQSALRIDLRQVFYGSAAVDAAVVEREVERLNRSPDLDAETLGERSMLDHVHADVSAPELANLFGQRFANAVIELEPGLWHGPVESGYGTHAVIIDARRGASPPQLEQVRDAVLSAWQDARRVQMVDDFYDGLLEKYEVTIDWPESVPAAVGAGGSS